MSFAVTAMWKRPSLFQPAAPGRPAPSGPRPPTTQEAHELRTSTMVNARSANYLDNTSLMPVYHGIAVTIVIISC